MPTPFCSSPRRILTQSRDTFQGVLRDLNFGELFVGNYVPENLDNLFISVQTMNSQKLYEKLNSDYYDFIIVDDATCSILIQENGFETGIIAA